NEKDAGEEGRQEGDEESREEEGHEEDRRQEDHRKESAGKQGRQQAGRRRRPVLTPAAHQESSKSGPDLRLTSLVGAAEAASSRYLPCERRENRGGMSSRISSNRKPPTSPCLGREGKQKLTAEAAPARAVRGWPTPYNRAMPRLSPTEAATALHAGGVIAYPTEAVWGLGCNPFDEAAVQRLLAIKQRPVDKGLILIAASVA